MIEITNFPRCGKYNVLLFSQKKQFIIRTTFDVYEIMTHLAKFNMERSKYREHLWNRCVFENGMAKLYYYNGDDGENYETVKIYKVDLVCGCGKLIDLAALDTKISEIARMKNESEQAIKKIKLDTDQITDQIKKKFDEDFERLGRDIV
jgi:hypothetical protein